MNSIYKKNLDVLEKLSPTVAERMKGLDAGIVLDDFFRDNDPASVAREFVDRFDIPEEADMHVISGAGLWHHVRELARRRNDRTWLVVIEGRDDIFRAAIDRVDISDILMSPRVAFFVGDNLAEFQSWFRSVLGMAMPEAVFHMHHDSSKTFPAFYSYAKKAIQNATDVHRVEVSTLIKMAPMMERNAVRNIPAISRARGVNDYARKYKGVPIIVVAAGPSLGENLDLLRDIQDRAVIICVGRVFKLLLDRGINPDFVATLDMTEATAAAFDGISETSTTLLFDQDGFYVVQEKYPGPMVTFETVVPTSQWFSRYTASKGELDKGMTVAHTAWSFAHCMNPSGPVILLGVDLAFPGERTHVDGAQQTWGGKVDGANIEEKFVDVPCVSGGKVKTLESFKAFISAFESLLSRKKTTTINCTSGGAVIRGARHIQFSEVVDDGIIPERVLVKPKLNPSIRFDRDAFVRDARGVIGQCEHIKNICENGKRWLKQAERLDITNKMDVPKLKKLRKKIASARNEILARKTASTLLQRLTSEKALKMRSLSREIDESKSDVEKHAGLQNEWFRLMFDAYGDAAKQFSDDLEYAIEGVR